MVPLQTLGERAASWLTLLALVFGPGIVATLLWSPFLASDRIRALFRALPPTGSLVVTYPVVGIGASLPYVIGTGQAVVSTSGQSGAAIANALLDVIVPVSIGYVVGIPVLAGVVLPRVGIDWDPTGYGPSTWALLVLGAAWYAAVFAVPLFLVAVVVAMPT